MRTMHVGFRFAVMTAAALAAAVVALASVAGNVVALAVAAAGPVVAVCIKVKEAAVAQAVPLRAVPPLASDAAQSSDNGASTDPAPMAGALNRGARLT